MPKEKKLTRRQLKTKLDEWFSKAIRYRAADKDGFAECFTCGTRHHVGYLHCGHFASRRHMATRWHDPEDGYGNCMPQCAKCNLFDQGRQWDFGRRLDEHVPGRAAEIMREAQRERTYELEELREMLQRYRTLGQREMDTKPAVLKRPPKTEADTRPKKQKTAHVARRKQ